MARCFGTRLFCGAKFRGWVVVLAVALVALGCGGAAQGEPGAEAPLAVSSPRGPAGPHGLALQRQLQEPWAQRTDKDGQLSVPLADAKGWKRVRFWAVEHLVGFKYSDELNALNLVMVFDVPAGSEVNPRTCMRVAEQWGRERVRDFQVQMSAVREETVRWRKQNILVHRSDAEVALGFESKHFSAAWAAYPAYERACLLFAQAVPWDGERALAEAVLDRWISEGVARLTPLTEEPPRRK